MISSKFEGQCVIFKNSKVNVQFFKLRGRKFIIFKRWGQIITLRVWKG